VTLAAAADSLPGWTVLPFVAYLLAIALLPLAAPRFWHRNRNKLLVALAAALPVALYLLFGPERGGHWLAHTAKEYAAFIALLGALYVIAGGVRLKGSLAGTPLTNTSILGIGALIASVIGTTGASMILIRPLLRANERRVRKTHIVIFFIFIVSNAGGLLTPLGDPPLFLGFLRGVPFLWTLGLVLPWILVNGILLALFNLIDQSILNKEERARPGAQLEEVQALREPLRLEGGVNLLLLAGVVGLIFVMGQFGPRIAANEDARLALQIGGMLLLAGVSLAATPRGARRANGFTWHPMAEVAAIFIGVFVTMVPALQILNAMGADGRIAMTRPWQFFWATGLLSSFLDNAPTYLTFGSLAAGLKGVDPDRLGDLLARSGGEPLLAAISCGAVFFGAMTYVGNGPNFMVKAIAEERGVAMPGFFRYMAWSGAVLLPLFAAVSLLFFR
jgi:Na+/H+ antiporter NhaD/arsenite permease-like protein